MCMQKKHIKKKLMLSWQYIYYIIYNRNTYNERTKKKEKRIKKRIHEVVVEKRNPEIRPVSLRFTVHKLILTHLIVWMT